MRAVPVLATSVLGRLRLAANQGRKSLIDQAVSDPPHFPEGQMPGSPLRMPGKSDCGRSLST